MPAQLEPLREMLRDGLDRQGLQPPGGARNALDCALWELEARLAGQPVWQLDGPSLVAQDCEPSVRYENGCVFSPARLWG